MVSVCVRGEVDQRALQVDQQGGDQVDLVAQPEANVGRDLVVARAAGVQALAGVAGELDQARLDVEMDVLELDLPGELAALDLPADRRQAALDRGQVGGGDDVDVGEHRRVGEAAGDVGAPQPAIEGDARRVAFHELAHRLGKERRPSLGFFLELVSGHGWRRLPGAGQACASHGLLAASAPLGPTAGRRLATMPGMCQARIRTILSTASRRR